MVVKISACIRPETHYFKGQPRTGEIVSTAKSEGRLNTPFIVIHAIFRRLIIKLTRKHSRLEINTQVSTNMPAGAGCNPPVRRGGDRRRNNVTGATMINII
jgi:hypothetical protein